MPYSGNPAFRDVLDPATKWLRAEWERQTAAGETDLGWSAWARAQGIIVSTSPTQWDDLRRVSLVPLSSVVQQTDDATSPGAFNEPAMSRIVPPEGRRRRKRRTKRPTSLDGPA